MKVLTAPFGSVLAGMSIENTEEALAMDVSKVVHKGVCILHCPSPTFVRVL